MRGPVTKHTLRHPSGIKIIILSLFILSFSNFSKYIFKISIWSFVLHVMPQSFLGECWLPASSRRKFQASHGHWTLSRQRQRYTPSELLRLRIGPELFNSIDQRDYTLTVIAGFNDHYTSTHDFSNNWKKILKTIIDKFHPRFIFVPTTIGSTNNRFLNNQIKNLNYALYKLVSSFTHPTIQIVSPYFNFPFNHFCKDGIHFFFYG